MQRTCKRTLSAFLAMLLICAYAALVPVGAQDAEPLLEITANTHRVHRNETLTLSVNTDDPVTWSSNDEGIAVVSDTGVVKGIAIGSAIITVQTKDQKRSAEFTVNVVRPSRFWRDLLEKKSILGYRYNYDGDYYYTDDVDCWQKYFGFNFIYDTIAPLYWIEYDYVRVFFTYEGKDWMVQMWKGQYGLVFYGSEIGVYNKPEGKSTASLIAHYGAATDEPDIKIGNTMYRQNARSGEYEMEYTHPYDTHWWNAGFIPGHLRRTGRCDELRTVSHITLKDEQMAALFAEGLDECGFRAVRKMEAVGNDSYYRSGKDVYLQWQDISQGVNTHVTQTVFWGGVAMNGFFLLLILGFILMLALAVVGGGAFLLFLI